MSPNKSHPAGPLTVITTHINADFDAMASLLAAQKLYPEAVVVFPGSQERNLRNFFIKSMVYLFNMADLKDLAEATITRLVLVQRRWSWPFWKRWAAAARSSLTLASRAESAPWRGFWKIRSSKCMSMTTIPQRPTTSQGTKWFMNLRVPTPRFLWKNCGRRSTPSITEN